MYLCSSCSFVGDQIRELGGCGRVTFMPTSAQVLSLSLCVSVMSTEVSCKFDEGKWSSLTKFGLPINISPAYVTKLVSSVV